MDSRTGGNDWALAVADGLRNRTGGACMTDALEWLNAALGGEPGSDARGDPELFAQASRVCRALVGEEGRCTAAVVRSRLKQARTAVERFASGEGVAGEEWLESWAESAAALFSAVARS